MDNYTEKEHQHNTLLSFILLLIDIISSLSAAFFTLKYFSTEISVFSIIGYIFLSSFYFFLFGSILLSLSFFIVKKLR